MDPLYLYYILTIIIIAIIVARVLWSPLYPVTSGDFSKILETICLNNMCANTIQIYIIAYYVCTAHVYVGVRVHLYDHAA